MTANEDLRAFRYHTGGTPRPLDEDEPCPILFRDIGVDAMIRFLESDLTSLAGPLSPITYLRTADYREPYVDYGRIGRLMILPSASLVPWHSGIEPVYIASRKTIIEPQTMVFLPSQISMPIAAEQFDGTTCLRDIEDTLGKTLYRDMRLETQTRLGELQRSHRATEKLAAPVRKDYQSMDGRRRERAREWMQGVALTEVDLCAAWHHLPDDRRKHIQETLNESPYEKS